MARTVEEDHCLEKLRLRLEEAAFQGEVGVVEWLAGPQRVQQRAQVSETRAEAKAGVRLPKARDQGLGKRRGGLDLVGQVVAIRERPPSLAPCGQGLRQAPGKAETVWALGAGRPRFAACTTGSIDTRESLPGD